MYFTIFRIGCPKWEILWHLLLCPKCDITLVILWFAKGGLIVNYRLAFGALHNLSFRRILKLSKFSYFALILVTTKWNLFGLLFGQQNSCWISPLGSILLSTVYIFLAYPESISYTLTRWDTFRIAPKFDRLSSEKRFCKNIRRHF